MARIRAFLAAGLLGAALAAGSPAAAQDQDTPLDRALQRIEAMIASLRAQPNPDQRLIDQLQEVADDLREEKESRGRNPGGAPPGTPPPGGGVAEWALNEAKRSFTRGCDLKEDERAVADQILVEFAADYNLARTNEDEKSKAVVREHTEKRVGRTFAARDANKMKDNLDNIIKFWEGPRGGWRGGR